LTTPKFFGPSQIFGLATSPIAHQGVIVICSMWYLYKG